MISDVARSKDTTESLFLVYRHHFGQHRILSSIFGSLAMSTHLPGDHHNAIMPGKSHIYLEIEECDFLVLFSVLALFHAQFANHTCIR
jgi:hypothetical protein